LCCCCAILHCLFARCGFGFACLALSFLAVLAASIFLASHDVIGIVFLKNSCIATISGNLMLEWTGYERRESMLVVSSGGLIAH
jgi:vacuolar-type H+-ATPase subunit I/STV1